MADLHSAAANESADLSGLAARAQAATHPIADSLAEVGHGLCGKPEPADTSGACWYKKPCPIHGTTHPPSRHTATDRNTVALAINAVEFTPLHTRYAMADAVLDALTADGWAPSERMQRQIDALTAERDHLAAKWANMADLIDAKCPVAIPKLFAGCPRDDDADLDSDKPHQCKLPAGHAGNRHPCACGAVGTARETTAALDRISKEGP